ncbi:hypothetical protein TNCV_220791 [Trichonephila clavipes]|nr:hypothetical protein TNCV_220791 [Trichonephila clavipes]
MSSSPGTSEDLLCRSSDTKLGCPSPEALVLFYRTIYDVNTFVVVVSFLKGTKEGCQNLRQVGLFYDRGRHHLSPPPQFRCGTGGEGNILQPPALVVSDATAQKTL